LSLMSIRRSALDGGGPRSVASDHLSRGDPRHPLRAAYDSTEPLPHVAPRTNVQEAPLKGVGCRGRSRPSLSGSGLWPGRHSRKRLRLSEPARGHRIASPSRELTPIAGLLVEGNCRRESLDTGRSAGERSARCEHPQRNRRSGLPRGPWSRPPHRESNARSQVRHWRSPSSRAHTRIQAAPFDIERF
jgi:hypothetical protein